MMKSIRGKKILLIQILQFFFISTSNKQQLSLNSSMVRNLVYFNLPFVKSYLKYTKLS